MPSGGAVAILGGSGYVGRALTAALTGDGAPVWVLTRSAGVPGLPPGARAVTWSPDKGPEALGEALAGAAAVVNLAGENIGAGRWTDSRRQDLVRSRVSTTRLLVSAIAGLERDDRPAVLASASGIDYYGDRGDDAVTERDDPGSTFLARLCAAWEAAACEAESLEVRVVRLRTGLVLSRDSAALARLVLPFRYFIGGRLGGGRQWVSWIHLADLVGLYRLALDDAELSGPLNAAAPDPRRQEDLAGEIGQLLHRPAVVPVPAPALRLVLGMQAELVLHGRRAAPEAALQHGYTFHYPTLEDALGEALG
ncbi:MAG: TIGR01777 family oxidoreductase [Candidatus Dormibacteraeota bacterium]|nr:TIGR01777 family oxidoreductase [Candidatus Dormibacteraeota bacterium]